MPSRKLSPASLLSFGLAALLAGACGGGDQLDLAEPIDTSTGASGSAGTGSSGAGMDFDPGEGSGEHASCATSAEEATLVPINMLIAVDRSGSMADDGKWASAKAAFRTFFEDPEADSLDVALRFWPEGDCSDEVCSVDACSQPHVGLGSLGDADHEERLVDAFESYPPDGWTPMSAALAGATKWAQQEAENRGGTEKVVVVLLTDGIPTACDTDIDSIASHAAAAYDDAGVLTFAVGLEGSKEGQLNTIALAGETNHGYFIGNGNAQADLLATLKEIQRSVVACSFAMPESDNPSVAVDPRFVNMTYTPSTGAAGVTIPQVEGKSACGVDGGWYYDDPTAPAVIELCSATCGTVQADPGAHIEVVLGCATEVH